MIEGVLIREKSIFSDNRGKVMHIMKATDEHYNSFGEVYCSTIFPGAIKGWSMHKKTTSNYTVIKGEIKLVLFDSRINSNSYKNIQEIIIGESNYVSVLIPPLVWVAFKCVGLKESFLINVINVPYDKNETLKMKIDCNNIIDYDWS